MLTMNECQLSSLSMLIPMDFVKFLAGLPALNNKSLHV